MGCQGYAWNMLAFTPTPVPLVTLEDGTIRVTGTRVPLDTIVYAFRAGSTPQDITRMYTTVTLEAAYAVIAWVLQNKDEVDAYLAKREAEHKAIQEEEERLHPPEGIKARLLARKAARSGST
jgi:uncharacterized protein (DUF433 family)